MTETHDCSYRSPLRCHDRQFFYKYVSAVVAKIILKNGNLRWNSPLLFNDPFDVTQELRLNFDAAELSATFVEEFAVLIDEGNHSAVPTHPALRVFLNVLNRQHNPHLRQKIVEELRRDSSAPTAGALQAFAALKQRWREFVPTLRILCLSELKDVTSMWLHYADSYRGAVLEFECVDQLDSASLVARPMIYQDTLPAIASKQVWARCMLGRAEKTYHDLFTEYQYVKTTAWSYEREWRIVTLVEHFVNS